MTFAPQPKQPGRALERHTAKLALRRADRAVKADVKRRDKHRCRWPNCEYRAVGQSIDAAHIVQAAGMGGDKQLLRTTRDSLMAICRLHHRTGPKNLHNGGLRIVPLTAAGTDGPCEFHRHSSDLGWYVAEREAF